MIKKTKLLTILSISFCVLILFGCEKKPKTDISTLNDVCELYANVAQEKVDVDEKEYLIAKRIADRLPYLMEENYKQLMSVDAKDRYAMFKKLADTIDKDANWECPIMQEYFKTLIDDYSKR